MNHIPALRYCAVGAIRRWLLGCALLAFAACGVEPSESADQPESREYGVHFTVRPDPASGDIAVTMRIDQPRDLVREVAFPEVPDTLREFSGDGDIILANSALAWLPPPNGGSLRWVARVENQRGSGGFDAWLGPEWGLFRAEDIIPRARTRSLKGALSNTTMEFELPAKWSVVTEYPATEEMISVTRGERRFDQPAGWIVVGDLGVRRERIAGIRVAVAAPQGEDVRRMDMLALLNWTLPELVSILPDPPTRLTIVSAGDPMWRGGLSAPASLYIHSERPLISENGTSTLLHEVMHTSVSLRAANDMDWIIEGLAEYYSLELLRRGGAITAARYATALESLANWAEDAEYLCGPNSKGPTTARAVIVMKALDEEIRGSSEASLDDLLNELLTSGAPVDIERLADIAAKLMGQASDVLHIDNLPGCHNIGTGNHAR